MKPYIKPKAIKSLAQSQNKPTLQSHLMHLSQIVTSNLLHWRSQCLNMNSKRSVVKRRAVKPIIKKNTDITISAALAYSILLVAVFGAIAATPYLNWAFLVYLIIVLVIRLSSQYIFMAALISLVLIPVSSTLHHNLLANSIAVMAFYFLAIGLLRAIIEN